MVVDKKKISGIGQKPQNFSINLWRFDEKDDEFHRAKFGHMKMI
jgi:hypothetical protein